LTECNYSLHGVRHGSISLSVSRTTWWIYKSPMSARRRL